MPVSKNRKNHKEKVQARGASRAEFRRLYEKEMLKIYNQQFSRFTENMAKNKPVEIPHDEILGVETNDLIPVEGIDSKLEETIQEVKLEEHK